MHYVDSPSVGHSFSSAEDFLERSQIGPVSFKPDDSTGGPNSSLPKSQLEAGDATAVKENTAG